MASQNNLEYEESTEEEIIESEVENGEEEEELARNNAGQIFVF